VSEQLRLIDPDPPALTERQQHVLDRIAAAGEEGLHTEEVGAVLHARNGRHAADELCAYCARDGRSVAEELKKKGRVAMRARPTRWVVAGTPRPSKVKRSSWVDDGSWPEGFMPTVCCAAGRAIERRAA
jgi:hypothetical protein